MTYKCTNGFQLMEFNSKGNKTGQFLTVKEGTFWKRRSMVLFFNEIVLDCISDDCELGWIVIPEEILKECFEIESEVNNAL